MRCMDKKILMFTRPFISGAPALLFSVFAVFIFGSTPAAAEYPDKPVKLVVPFPRVVGLTVLLDR